jgi:hypothetical protein
MMKFAVYHPLLTLWSIEEDKYLVEVYALIIHHIGKSAPLVILCELSG